ncbi:MAG: hypothetical protein M1832_000165 [Thelocarpon impressellum]|nr:MAG: hypothetical protein M1832_000165 [Thelocarpon impressellum]
MAHQAGAPYAPQDTQSVSNLLLSLEAHTKKPTTGEKSFGCKKVTFTVPGANGLAVDSWKFQDWDYKRDDLPTYARGLFTHRSPDGRADITVRGYDKFFNIDEVAKTRWSNIETNTRGPYELSLKENGCIIFISGLSDGSLLVCSKHSTGARQDADLSHAVAGERWVDRLLQAAGRTRADLARELRRRNATAVAELCDDSFEEHVLAYGEDRAGLYLHGINLNLPEFTTYPCHLVHRFAEEWGFRKTEFLVKDDIHSVRTFLETVAENGAWEGRDVEGFVIRCQARDAEGAPWVDWFFKYKFEEPYLMYRQWREVTKSLIAGKPPRYKKHRKITEEYMLYARSQLARDAELGVEFCRNHGIIAMRDGFLKHKGVTGSDLIRQEPDEDGQGSADVTRDVVLVPIATLGCGKTTVAVALQKLFGWGHVQNDNVQGKVRRPQRFVGEICAAMAAYPVVFADRNNHQRREREQIIEDIHRFVPNARLVALHYVHGRHGARKQHDLEQIRRVTRERVIARGDNHQTIQAGSKSPEEILGIMEGFLQRFEPLDPHNRPDDGFDEVVDLDVTASSRENVETIVSYLHDVYPSLFQEMPTSDDLDEAIEETLRDYHPDIKHDLSFSKDKTKGKARPGQAQQNGPSPKEAKEAKVDFFCIRLPAQQVTNALESLFATQPAEVASFYRQLQHQRRVQDGFHVTMIHRANAVSHAAVWQRLLRLYTAAVAASASRNPNDVPSADPSLGECRVQLERVVWDQRVMCVVARLPDSHDNGFHTTNEVAHVTVGTASADIKPKESNDLLARWLRTGSGGASGIGELQVPPANNVLFGSARAVLQRRG